MTPRVAEALDPSPDEDPGFTGAPDARSALGGEADEKSELGRSAVVLRDPRGGQCAGVRGLCAVRLRSRRPRRSVRHVPGGVDRIELDQGRGTLGSGRGVAPGPVSRAPRSGVFGIIPIIDTIPYWIDIRVITSSFKAEKTLTRDTVPVDVDAVLFWKVIDSEKAALAVADYVGAISWASQTALRDIIGKTQLADMLEGREKISTELQRIIDLRTEPWGVKVVSVEVRDVLIPPGLENAMSMQAQAERERQARVILGDSERQVAEKFGEAAKTYEHDPIALHLRAMNMLYEGLKQNATIVLVPSSALETMQLGGLAGVTAMTAALKGKDGEVAIPGAPH